MVRVILACVLAASIARAQTPDGGVANVNANVNAIVNEEPPPKPLVKKPFFWLTVIGGIGVIAAGITLAVVLDKPRDPAPTWGIGVGN